VGDEAFAPLADGMTIAVQFRRDLPVGGRILSGSAENEAAAKDQGLRGRAGAEEGLELVAEFRRKNHA
jgi:hypothetical protein